MVARFVSRFNRPPWLSAESRPIGRRRGARKPTFNGATAFQPWKLGLLEKVESSAFRLFILETNGILIGTDRDYARQLARLKKVHTRVSLKAGTPEAFTRKTGATAESFDLPFQAVVNLLTAGASFHVAAMSADARRGRALPTRLLSASATAS